MRSGLDQAAAGPEAANSATWLMTVVHAVAFRRHNAKTASGQCQARIVEGESSDTVSRFLALESEAEVYSQAGHGGACRLGHADGAPRDARHLGEAVERLLEVVETVMQYTTSMERSGKGRRSTSATITSNGTRCRRTRSRARCVAPREMSDEITCAPATARNWRPCQSRHRPPARSGG